MIFAMGPIVICLVLVISPGHASRLKFDFPCGAAPDFVPCTEKLQAFLEQSADTLVFPPRAGGYVTGPLQLKRSLATLLFLPGADLRAAKGAFPRKGDCLFTIREAESVKLIGYGSGFIMRKEEYTEGEWRMALKVMGSKNVVVEGLRLDSSGGDGLYIGSASGKGVIRSENIRVSHCSFSGNRRQGISIISVRNFLMEHCLIRGTVGASPQAGIDFEPNGPGDHLTDCRVRNCVFIGNRGGAVKIGLHRLEAGSSPVSIDFQDCLFSGEDSGRGVDLSGFSRALARGRVRFHRCLINKTRTTLMETFKGDGGPDVVFQECEFDGETGAAKTRTHPIISLRPAKNETSFGGFQLENCIVRSSNRPIFSLQTGLLGSVRDVRISIFHGGAAPSVPTGVSWTRVEKEPNWPPPPPRISGFRALAGEAEVVVGNWAHDSLSYGTKLRKGSSWSRETVARIAAGDTLRAVSFRNGASSDTLVWTAPTYLGKAFSN